MNPGDQDLKSSRKQSASTGLSFEAFYGKHQHGWIRYAFVETGSREAAERITDGVTAHLAKHWLDLHTAEKAAEHAWKVLKATITRWLDDHDAKSALIETAAFDRTTRRVLARVSDRFAEMEEAIGLYSAISRLPETQRDVIILRYVLGYDDSAIAWMLGMSEGAVRSSVCLGKKRIAKELGHPHLIRTEA